MPRHEKTAPTTSMQVPEWMSQAAKAAGPSRWRTWQVAGRALLCTTSLVAVVVLIATAYELQVGEHAGFGRLAWLVPLVVGPYVIWTWTDQHARWWDELGAVGLLLASVGLSVTDLPPTRLKLAVGAVLIATEWRMVVRGRASFARRDVAAEAGRIAAAAVAEVDRIRRESEEGAAEWRRQVATLEDAAAADQVVAAAAAAPGDGSGRSGDGSRSGGSAAPPAADLAAVAAAAPAWGWTMETQTEWLRRELAAGRNYTGEQVAELMGLNSARTGRSRLAEARRLRIAKEA
jgi:hypothetical protein